MAYDSPKYNVTKSMMFEYATYGAVLGTTATNTNVKTSANFNDRVEFFEDIKLTGFKYMPDVAPDCGAHATSMTSYAEFCLGTTVLARASVGTVAGVMADGTIVSANVDSGTSCNLRFAITGWDGTVQTMAPGAGRAYIQYQERI